jgi:uncharacterized damage-inducible protein DinB
MHRQEIIELLRRTFDGAAWHGPSVMETLRKVLPEELGHRIGNSHTLIELVEHMTAWRRFAIEKMRGNTTYDVDEQANFPKVDPNQESWQITLQQFEDSQLLLLEQLEQMDDSRLEQLVEGRNYSYSIMLHGLIHHDVYHLGQIVLLRK